jgi:hypothetical protein
MKTALAIILVCMHVVCFAARIAPNLTAVYDPQEKVVKLKWQNNNVNTNSFVLQRSADNNHWTDLYKVDAGELNEHKIEKYTDPQPDPNKNYYRLKMSSSSNKTEFSPSIMVIIGNPQGSWVMYPVPVITVLNLQYTGSDPIQGVVSVFIQNSQGKVLARLRSSSLVRTIQIPVTNLGRGIYDVKIVIMDKIVWNQRFVK